MYDLVALGELLIDFAPVGERSYQANAGGAPANVLAALSRLGGRTAFIGMVGEDDFGAMLRADIERAGIDARGLKATREAPTTLAFVNLDERGDRSFTFIRNPGADLLLREEDVDLSLIGQAKIFHFGSVSLTGGPARGATLYAARWAKEHGITVSYDPNLRPLLWKGLDEAKEVILSAMGLADILKISEEELLFLTGTSDFEAGSQLLSGWGPKIVFVTLGAQGCFYRYPGGCGTLPTFAVKAVDTTGAGDAFFGGVLSKISATGFENVCGYSREAFEEVVRFGNGVGSYVTTRKGAIPAMPDLATVENFMKDTPLQGE
ncbi:MULTISPECIES: carbohydrate kinase family protein [Oscillospiraceae]|uniref:carbohydrate kinase family protein n=1 Tax=Oscillospiraceae TaxID=216572 RepID=UPI0009A84734|nr:MULTISPECIES: carbohydrate kinase [Oscillospiraceae]RGB69737.1 carbohydrate kinase [Harryflintia acetispora]